MTKQLIKECLLNPPDCLCCFGEGKMVKYESIINISQSVYLCRCVVWGRQSSSFTYLFIYIYLYFFHVP